ncbi:YcgN family cysteine cluster protein [Fastidiosibacter lacustris]|uniref:YcgN family cysteine cluster protein n=1 Tax=Fastidiosibacter lacustris TaxID=2056695 RepID=UPI000E355FBD|nr:YcgN family cysteine cluster protein [Fastidiosibacter lacustris]
MSQTLRPNFWQKIALSDMTASEWEALCDGCGLCCLHKLQDDETNEIYYTKVACKLLDCKTCQCSNYPKRKQLVPNCLQLDVYHLRHAQHWLPNSCAYKRLYQGKNLPSWHPLITQDKNSVHKIGISAARFAISELKIKGNLEDYLLAKP